MARSRSARLLWALLLVPALLLVATPVPAAQEAVGPPVFVRAWGGSGAAPGQFNTPRGVATFGSNVYVVDGENHRVQKFRTTGELKSTWGGYGTQTGQFISPSGIAVDGSGYVYVVDTWNNRVQRFTPSGTFVRSWGRYGSTYGRFRFPSGIAVDASGDVYVVDTYNDRIQVFTRNGTFLRAWGTLGSSGGQFNTPVGIAYNSSRIYVADSVNNRVQAFTTTGTYLRSWGGAGSLPGQFDQPQWVATDAMGSVYVTDANNARVQQFSRAGRFETEWGSYGTASGQFHWPQGVAVNDAREIFVVDQGNSRVQSFLPVIRRSDAMVWHRGVLVGDNIYNTSATNQGQAANVQFYGSGRGRQAFFAVYAQNDGTMNDSLLMRQLPCIGNPDRFKVTYTFYDAVGAPIDITTQMTGGGFQLDPLAPRRWRSVDMVIKARTNVRLFDWVSCRVVVSSVSDPSVTDAVKARVTVT